jgi:hypothetical protein
MHYFHWRMLFVLRDPAIHPTQKWPTSLERCRPSCLHIAWWRGRDSNPRPLGYEPNELPLLHPALRADRQGGARSGLASHGVTPAVLSGAALGHDRVRDGSGWSQNALGHGHRPAGNRRDGEVWPRSTRPGGERGVFAAMAAENPPSAMSTGRLRSVTGRPPPASLPGRLPGAFLLSNGEPRLGAGFPLRCFQRFAQPDVATQRCRLPDNWLTSGPSSPVLSY